MADLATIRAIPAISELAQLRQWVAWRMKLVVLADGTQKITKPPVNPILSGGASHSDPSTWGTFDQARIFAMTRGLPGIGFVLAETDEFTGIDLDKCRNPETGEIEDWAREILNLNETYAEISPSGTGIRMIARGKVSHATKCDPAHVEVYGKQRYLTITGDRLPRSPDTIEPAPMTLAALLARVKASQAEAAGSPSNSASPRLGAAAPPKARKKLNFVFGERKAVAPKDGEIAPPAPKTDERKPDFFRAVNDKAMDSLDVWFPHLFPAAKPQPGTGGWRVSSRALGRNLEEDLSAVPGANGGITDFGVHDMGDARGGKRTPISIVQEWGGQADVRDAARWLCDAMGVDPTSLGWRDRPSEDKNADARKIIVDDDGSIIDAETGEVLSGPTADPTAEARQSENPPLPSIGEAQESDSEVGDDLPPEITYAPGLLGDIVDWYLDTAIGPSRTMALATAIMIVGTAAGRYWCGPTRTPTHLYSCILAESGTGKNHIGTVINRIFTAAQLESLLGPSDFMSQSALLSHVCKAPLSLCVMDEFGGILRRIQGKNKRVSSFEMGISQTMRTLWGTSFDRFASSAYATKEQEVVFAPALSVSGVSTAEEFWRALEGSDVSNGFLNRFLIFNVYRKPPTVKPKIGPADQGKPPACITDKILKIMAGGNPLRRGEIVNPRLARKPITPRVIPFANAEAERVYYDYSAVASQRFLKTDHAAYAPFFARAAENSLRVASIYALSVNQKTPTISIEAMLWARDLVEWSAMQTARSAMLYIAESETQENANSIKRMLKDAPRHMLTRSEIMRKLNNRIRRRDLDDVITMMLEAHQIVQLVETGKRAPGKAGRAPIRYQLNADFAP